MFVLEEKACAALPCAFHNAEHPYKEQRSPPGQSGLEKSQQKHLNFATLATHFTGSGKVKIP